MKQLIFALSIVALSACSEPSGWMLWSHTYSITDGRTSGDDWVSHESFFKLAQCKSQLQTEIATRARYWEENQQEESKDAKFTIQKEKESLKLTWVRLLKDKQETSSVSVARFYCMALGVDPRPKDLSTWILWAMHTVSQGGKTVKTEGWDFAGGYLTETACNAARYSQQKSNDELNLLITEKRKDSATKIVRTSFYTCIPSGVPP